MIGYPVCLRAVIPAFLRLTLLCWIPAGATYRNITPTCVCSESTGDDSANEMPRSPLHHGA